MHLHLRADSVHLSESHAKALDDEFFLSHPAAYFGSRISSLLAADRSAAAAAPADEPEFFAALGLTKTDTLPSFEEQDRSLQVAVEALSLRHQAAEALMRFMYAVTAAKLKEGDAPSTWLAIADSPTKLVDVVQETIAALEADEELFLRCLFTPGTHIDEQIAAAEETAVAWLNHASSLLTGDELSVNAAYNKVKHGLAVSARDDVRIEFVTTPPDDLGQIPLTAFGEGKSVPIFDRPMLTYLTRPHGKPKQGVEAISLRVDVPVVLAEAWMIVNVYAAMFHSRARHHFGDDLPDGVAPYPTLVIGRLPEHVIGSRPLGYRSPVTLPPDGTTAPRESGLFFHGSFIPMDIDFDSKVKGVVVDG
ncbi:hypothetical protein C5E02_03760 [Rathayibacter rathayi]|uniref:DUF4238 domain-containing protein n=1 Tax=Rathayibacter rathayi TaxID=33887 RepID=A0ABD6W9Y4_RATRA|nr:hypothetical protein [Rathayibacter rathayi]AZZ48455.1 hypothetical protein C1O28_03960 [Rathayibacter rathayi]MWV74369.1 hypothetical protein [Rathayibacter rathayi NCPPB 2980 = VKM Ac-1601]PPF14830.1 hypothetical protein C5C04_05295 [Rathayibacter rathayi]PPF50093.1 hypothetical protein C5C08_05975 [Rathayibacter rathayi]PPG70082.1 hypothetical protein C5C16_04910 [Rathayibacter rathayi]